jgi:monofunctional biosynthetic peptidoglycan transglycosylase
MASQGTAAGAGGRRLWARARRALVLAVAGFFTLSIGLVVVYRFLPPPLTPLMVIRLVEGEGLRKDWVPYAEVSPQVFRAVIAAEDTRFCQHYGFDLKSIEEAWTANRKGRRLRGASTITMQTSKNLFLWPGRDPLRKGLEAWFTVLLELFWDKRRILEVYVNIVEFGPGIYGIEAAAQAYYKKPAKDLSAGEAARLAAVLPSPLRRTPMKPGSQLARIRGEMRGQPPPLDERCPVGIYADR